MSSQAIPATSYLQEGAGPRARFTTTDHKRIAILYALKLTIGLRPTTQEEIEGLDLNQHGETVA